MGESYELLIDGVCIVIIVAALAVAAWSAYKLYRKLNPPSED